jgi:hypothetical protein
VSTDEWLPRTRITCIELHDWLNSGCAYAFYSRIFARRFNQYYPPPGLVNIVQFVEEHDREHFPMSADFVGLGQE